MWDKHDQIIHELNVSELQVHVSWKDHKKTWEELNKSHPIPWSAADTSEASKWVRSRSRSYVNNTWSLVLNRATWNRNRYKPSAHTAIKPPNDHQNRPSWKWGFSRTNKWSRWTSSAIDIPRLAIVRGITWWKSCSESPTWRQDNQRFVPTTTFRRTSRTASNETPKEVERKWFAPSDMNHFDVRYIINIPYLSDLGKVRTTLVALLGCRVVVFVFSKV